MSSRGHPQRGRRPGAARLLAGQLTYQVRLLVRSPMTFFASLVIPLMVLMAVGLLFHGRHHTDNGTIPWPQFFTPAMVAFAVLTCCYAGVITSTTLARDEGILKRLRSTPLPTWVYMTGKVITTGAVASLAAVVLVAVGAALYGFTIIWSSVPAAFLVSATAIVSFCALGIAISALVPSAEPALPIAWGSMLPACFISDIFQPLGDAPHWLLRLSAALPVRPLADELEDLFDPYRTGGIGWDHLAIIIAWGAGAAVLALTRFRFEPRRRSGHGGGGRGHGLFAVQRLHELLEVRHGGRRVSDHAGAERPAGAEPVASR